MLVILVFVASFIVLFSVTMVAIPALPPGQIICQFFANPEGDYLIFGASAELLVSGLINGLIWSAVIVLVYSYWRGPARAKVDLPIWVPGYTTSRGSAVKDNANKNEETYSSQIITNPQNIESVEGIGYIYGRKLRLIGINTVEDLLQKGSTRVGRIQIANRMDVTEATVLNWLRQAEIHR